MTTSEKELHQNILTGLASAIPGERAAACHSIADLFENSTSNRYLMLAEKFMPALLRRVETEPHVMTPLATAAHCLWGSQAYPEALACLEATMPYGSQEPLSAKRSLWADKSVPITRERELALHRLWRIECLFAMGRIDEGKASEVEAIDLATRCLPPQFNLTLSDFYEFGDARAFCLCARIRGAQALRLKAEGRDAHSARKLPKKPKPPKESEALQLRALAQRLIDEVLPELDRFLPEFARHDPKAGVVSVEEQRRLGKWRGQGYAEAGLLARDAGKLEEATRLLGIAHWLYAVIESALDIGVGREYMDPIRALAPEPRLSSTLVS